MISPTSRGTALFSSEHLQEVFEKTVAPELDDTHHVVGVGTVTREGVKAALVYHRPITVLGVTGEWTVEGAFLYDWKGEHDEEAKVLFKF